MAKSQGDKFSSMVPRVLGGAFFSPISCLDTSLLPPLNFHSTKSRLDSFPLCPHPISNSHLTPPQEEGLNGQDEPYEWPLFSHDPHQLSSRTSRSSRLGAHEWLDVKRSLSPWCLLCTSNHIPSLWSSCCGELVLVLLLGILFITIMKRHHFCIETMYFFLLC